MLNRLLAVEYHGIAAYTAATPLLTGTPRRMARQFLGHEVLHADRLLALVRRVSGQPVQPQASYDLGHPQGTKEVVQLLLQVERLQLSSYLAVIPALVRGSLKATASGILANQAQHAAVWRLQMGRAPAPQALVTGDEYG